MPSGGDPGAGGLSTAGGAAVGLSIVGRDGPATTASDVGPGSKEAREGAGSLASRSIGGAAATASWGVGEAGAGPTGGLTGAAAGGATGLASAELVDDGA